MLFRIPNRSGATPGKTWPCKIQPAFEIRGVAGCVGQAATSRLARTSSTVKITANLAAATAHTLCMYRELEVGICFAVPLRHRKTDAMPLTEKKRNLHSGVSGHECFLLGLIQTNGLHRKPYLSELLDISMQDRSERFPQWRSGHCVMGAVTFAPEPKIPIMALGQMIWIARNEAHLRVVRSAVTTKVWIPEKAKVHSRFFFQATRTIKVLWKRYDLYVSPYFYHPSWTRS